MNAIAPPTVWNLTYINQIFCVGSPRTCMFTCLIMFFYLFLVSSFIILFGSSEFYRPIEPKASQVQTFTFLVSDQRLKITMGSVQRPTGLDK